MSNIADLEKELSEILGKYEEKEMMTAEIVGVLHVLASQRTYKAISEHNVPFLRNLLEQPVEAVSGPPVGPVLTTIEGKDSMET
jgi:hypothetical protein